MKKTKIVCTIGPSSNNEEMLRKMIAAGMNVARFNFSHGSHETQKANLDLVKKVREEMNQRAPGFIEELEATLKVVSQSKVSLVFYIILFCLLTFLELFVLTIKIGENKCDYELVVENQLLLKRRLMEQTAQSILVKQ